MACGQVKTTENCGILISLIITMTIITLFKNLLHHELQGNILLLLLLLLCTSMNKSLLEVIQICIYCIRVGYYLHHSIYLVF